MRIVHVARLTFQEWTTDKCPRLAAALAFYSLLAIAPLLILTVSLVSLVYSGEAARAAVVAQMEALVGSAGATIAREVLANAPPQEAGFATVIGLALLLVGATGVVAQLQDAMNTIWGVRAPKTGWLKRLFMKRLLSLGFVVSLGFLFVVSLLLSTFLSAMGSWLGGSLAAGALAILQALLSLGIFTLLLAFAYKVLPDARVSWQDTWVGAGATAGLLVLGKWALGLYLGRGALGSAFGAAASLAVLLAWIFYSGLIFLFGAEFTQVHAALRGRPIEPSRGAVAIEPEQPAATPSGERGAPSTALTVATAATMGMLAWLWAQDWKAGSWRRKARVRNKEKAVARKIARCR